MPKKKEEREIERWITVNGARVPIFKGQSVAEAVKESVGKRSAGKKQPDKQKVSEATKVHKDMTEDEKKKKMREISEAVGAVTSGEMRESPDPGYDPKEARRAQIDALKKQAAKKASSKTENQRREDELKKQLKSLEGKEFDKDARVVIDDIRARLDEHRRFEGDREDMDARLKELKKKEAQITKTDAFNPEARKTLRDLRSRISEINKLKQNDAHEIPADKKNDGYPSEQEMRDYIKSKGKEKFVKELSGNTERGYQAALRNVYDQETLSPEEYGKKYFGKDYKYKGGKTADKTAKTVADNEAIKEKQLAANKMEADMASAKKAITKAKTYTKQDIPKGISAADREEISDLFKKGDGAWAYTEAMERAINKPLDGKKTSTEKSLRRNFENMLQGFEDTEYVVDDGPAKDFMRGMITDYKKRFEDNMNKWKGGSKSTISKESAATKTYTKQELERKSGELSAREVRQATTNIQSGNDKTIREVRQELFNMDDDRELSSGVTVKDLRKHLFEVENQDMTLGEFRQMLFNKEDQDTPALSHFVSKESAGAMSNVYDGGKKASSKSDSVPSVEANDGRTYTIKQYRDGRIVVGYVTGSGKFVGKDGTNSMEHAKELLQKRVAVVNKFNKRGNKDTKQVERAADPNYSVNEANMSDKDYENYMYNKLKKNGWGDKVARAEAQEQVRQRNSDLLEANRTSQVAERAKLESSGNKKGGKVAAIQERAAKRKQVLGKYAYQAPSAIPTDVLQASISKLKAAGIDVSEYESELKKRKK